ncbi:MAG: serine/threonine protein kinase [Myxococcales bacterium]|nr:serine/threonine protein kinase [Myxococcales bacterium]
MDELTEGQVIADRYRVRKLLGAGGMGSVWIAEHIELGKTVALKVMLPAMSANPEMRQRFINEGRAAASIGHPNIVEVFDLGFHGQFAFIAMEKLEGEELDMRIERTGPLPVSEAIRIAADLADAIGAAHELGIVHRDLKPANVFLATRGRQKDQVKVLDFGIAKLTQGTSDVNTKTGAVIGSPMYMAPEQLQDAKTVDARADVHAIGAILYAMLTGRPPYVGATLTELFYKIVSESPRPLREVRGDVPEWLERVVASALAKHPGERPPNGRALAALLEQREPAPAPVTTTSRSEPVLAPMPPVNEALASSALSAMSSTTAPRHPGGGGLKWLLAAGGLTAALLAGSGVWLATRAAPEPRSSAVAPLPPPVDPAVAPTPKVEPDVAPDAKVEAAGSAAAAPSVAAPASASARPAVGARPKALVKKAPAPGEQANAPPALVPR